MKVYLQPPAGFEPNTTAALALLNAHIQNIDPVAALELLPDKELTVAQLTPFLNAAIRYCNGKSRNTSVQRHLLHVDMVQLHTQLSRLQQRYVVTIEEQPCGVCHAPLVAGQPFAVRPDRSVTHVECVERAAM